MGKLHLCTIAVALAVPLGARAESELALVVQGGGVQYNRGLAGRIDQGVAYGARVGIMPNPIIGLEFGYLGTQNNLRDTLNGNDRRRLITNSALADLRVNLLPGAATPYLFGGYGVTSVSVSRETLRSPFHGDTYATVPFGAGIEVNAGAFKLGARLQYNHIVDEEGYGTPTDDPSSRKSDFYGFSVDLGASFR
jgi:hypothetical protein